MYYCQPVLDIALWQHPVICHLHNLTCYQRSTSGYWLLLWLVCKSLPDDLCASDCSIYWRHFYLHHIKTFSALQGWCDDAL